ncbi:MAG: hypothetical protein MJA83_04370 [Gammaproteobacteria bacterium]|nr:hypothetical protein [Gammaproteobacteria bacterium]
MRLTFGRGLRLAGHRGTQINRGRATPNHAKSAGATRGFTVARPHINIKKRNNVEVGY